MAAWSESLAAIAGSVSTVSTKKRVRIFRDEIPPILTNSGKFSSCLVAETMVRNWYLGVGYVLWISSLWDFFSIYGKLKQREIRTLSDCSVCLVVEKMMRNGRKFELECWKFL